MMKSYFVFTIILVFVLLSIKSVAQSNSKDILYVFAENTAFVKSEMQEIANGYTETAKLEDASFSEQRFPTDIINRFENRYDLLSHFKPVRIFERKTQTTPTIHLEKLNAYFEKPERPNADFRDLHFKRIKDLREWLLKRWTF